MSSSIFGEEAISLDKSKIYEMQQEKMRNGQIVTISQRDADSLKPRKYIADSIIAFWFRWIFQMDDNEGKSFCALNSQFYTCLIDEKVYGLEYCSNIYKKNDFQAMDFIYIPINLFDHWSLCVVVKPSCYNNHLFGKDEVSCLVLMDPLKSQQLHDKSKIAHNVHQWLDLTWRKRSLASVDVFDERTMPLISPSVIQQRNGYDCGLFICRYALAFYQVKNFKFTSDAVNSDIDKPLQSFAQQEPFWFDGSNAAMKTFRNNFLQLINKLHEIFRDNLDNSVSISGTSESSSLSNGLVDTDEEPNCAPVRNVRLQRLKKTSASDDELYGPETVWSDSEEKNPDITDGNVSNNQSNNVDLVKTVCPICQSNVYRGISCLKCNKKVHRDCSLLVSGEGISIISLCQHCGVGQKRSCNYHWS